jgi:hypothetical protein
MNALLRKVRGVLGSGLIWGVLWATIGALVGFLIRITIPGSMDPGENELLVAAIFGAIGFVSGAAFGMLLSFAESRKKILDLSLGRAAVWGILGAATFPLLTTMDNRLMIIFCPLGALSAAASVAIARRAVLRESEPPLNVPIS